MASRGPLGPAKVRKLPKWSPVAEPAPKVVSKGSVSKPKPLPKWRPGTLPQDATPKIVQK